MAKLPRRGRPPKVTLEDGIATVTCKGTQFKFRLVGEGRLNCIVPGATQHEDYDYARAVVLKALAN